MDIIKYVFPKAPSLNTISFWGGRRQMIRSIRKLLLTAIYFTFSKPSLKHYFTICLNICSKHISKYDSRRIVATAEPTNLVYSSKTIKLSSFFATPSASYIKNSYKIKIPSSYVKHSHFHSVPATISVAFVILNKI